MTSMFATLMAFAAAIVFFVSSIGFWLVCAFGLALLGLSYMTLKRAPQVSLDGLSEEARDLFARYRHAWVYAGMTHQTRFAVMAWSLVLLGTGAYFLLSANWPSFGAALCFLLAVFHISGKIDPTMYIRSRGLSQAHDEIVYAYLARSEAAAGRSAEWLNEGRNQRDDDT